MGKMIVLFLVSAVLICSCMPKPGDCDLHQYTVDEEGLATILNIDSGPEASVVEFLWETESYSQKEILSEKEIDVNSLHVGEKVKLSSFLSYEQRSCATPKLVKSHWVRGQIGVLR